MAAVVLLSGLALFVEGEAALQADAVFRRQEAGRIWPVEDHPPAGETNDDRGDTLEDEDPRPASDAGDAIH